MAAEGLAVAVAAAASAHELAAQSYRNRNNKLIRFNGKNINRYLLFPARKHGLFVLRCVFLTHRHTHTHTPRYMCTNDLG